MLGVLKSVFAPNAIKQQAFDSYASLVQQSRQPFFYRDWQVDDTMDGRFDIMVLHCFLILRRCEDETNAYAHTFNRYVSEAFFSDMDRSLREMGASDTGVGIRVKNMAQAFYGRVKSYREGMQNHAAMIEAVKRNIYRDRDVSPESLDYMASYIERNAQTLSALPFDAVMNGNFSYLN